LKIQIRTRFDITATNTRGNFNANRLPFLDRAGQQVSTAADWHRSRNQQRNWETINQLISLRTLPQCISDPEARMDAGGTVWSFDFDLENEGAFQQAGDPLGALKSDSQGVPMIAGLSEAPDTGSHLLVDINIWFSMCSDK
jgi:hypothetical protein